MTQAEIRSTVQWALNEMAQSDRMLEQSKAASIPSVAKLLKEDSSVRYRTALLTLKDAANKLT
jgi:hypothetical protein